MGRQNRKHIDEFYKLEPLATTTSLIREVSQALHTPVVKRSYYKNCAWCGKITTKDRWVENNERNDKRTTRPLCYKCGLEADYPEY